MTNEQLTLYSSWASIISLGVSLISLVYIRSIKTNIVRFRRKQRIRQLLDGILQIPDDALPLGVASKTKLAFLKRNIPVHFWSTLTPRGRAVVELHKHIDAEDIVSLKEAINDWTSYSEEA